MVFNLSTRVRPFNAYRSQNFNFENGLSLKSSLKVATFLRPTPL